MVGLADIPCFEKLVDKVPYIVVKALYRGLRYMFCYKSLVNELNLESGILTLRTGCPGKLKENKIMVE